MVPLLEQKKFSCDVVLRTDMPEESFPNNPLYPGAFIDGPFITQTGLTFRAKSRSRGCACHTKGGNVTLGVGEAAPFLMTFLGGWRDILHAFLVI
jgi:hypothetical protein